MTRNIRSQNSSAFVFDTLSRLREYALARGAQATFSWQREDSRLVRYANSAISLNTTEDVTRLSVTAFEARRSVSINAVIDPYDVPAMLRIVDRAIETLPHASEIHYSRTIPCLSEDTYTDANFDPELAEIDGAEITAFVERATRGLETDDIMLSGNFTTGVSERAEMSTASPHINYRRSTDAGITLVLSSLKDKWEINAEQFVWRKADLDPESIYERLAWMREQYLTRPGVRLPLGRYNIVLGNAALSEYANFLSYLSASGRMEKLGYSMLSGDDIGKQVLSPLCTLVEDPALLATFPVPVDSHGRRRERRAIFNRGVFTGFIREQSEADEYGDTPTGHDVDQLSLALMPGDRDIRTIQEFASLPRDRDILYIPYLHYVGIVNPSAGLITGTSRFGALYLKRNGGIELPYNVRLTLSLKDLFGKHLSWLSAHSEPYGSSSSYSARNPGSILVPVLGGFEDVEIEISNESF